MHNLIGKLHGRWVFDRRVNRLSGHLHELLKDQASVLDVGCGDGSIDLLLMRRQPELSIQGIDVLQRPHPHIPVSLYDGHRIPFADDHFDCVMFVDVLHHTDDIPGLLKEASRVARRFVVIKDHLQESALDHQTLRFMDWIGNAPHGVSLPYRYLSRAEWTRAFAEAGLEVDRWDGRLGLYPPPASWLFDRNLHFTARLRPT